MLLIRLVNWSDSPKSDIEKESLIDDWYGRCQVQKARGIAGSQNVERLHTQSPSHHFGR